MSKLRKRDVIELDEEPHVVIEVTDFGAKVIAIKKNSVSFIDKYGKKHNFSVKGKPDSISANSEVKHFGRMKKDKFKELIK